MFPTGITAAAVHVTVVVELVAVVVAVYLWRIAYHV